ncbi:MAG: DUF2341 domain-containing protein [Candidatus Hadarchaeales archaeon]
MAWADPRWWDENWKKRRPITISTHPENIHLKIILPYDSDMRPDFGDIRFLENENSGVLNFWIENYTPDNATVWVRRLENSDPTIYVYYGNPSATSTSSWENTILPYADVRATSNAQWSSRYAHTSLVFGGKIWIIGGGAENAENDVWCSTDGVNWTLVIDNAGWSSRKNHTSVVFNNRMWVLGGPDSQVWYSENGENWSLATSSPGWSARWGHTSVIFDGKIWVIGGYDGNYKNDVWCSSDGINWYQVTSSAAWSPRHSHSSVVFDNRMWVIGGYSSAAFKNDVWYSSDGENWFQATSSAGWTPRRHHASVIFDNRMWVIGGNGELWAEYLSDIWYSENGSSWTRVTGSTWSARYEHSAVVFRDVVWIAGGYDGNYRNDVWRILRKFADSTPVVEIGPEEPGWFVRENWSGEVTANPYEGWVLRESWSAAVTANPYSEWQISERWAITVTTPPPPPSKVGTTLQIDPSSFSLTSGGSHTLTATLKDANGNPLSGKTISWSAVKGTFSAASTTTDNSGKATVTYTAPSVTTTENVTITASFAEDGTYYGSTATSTATISPSPPASSFLSVTPTSFTLRSGENQLLTATLLSENGAPLANRTISWNATDGSITPTSMTNNLGQATATFTAPVVTTTTTVTITASFGGDASFAASRGSSTATVKPPLAKTVLALRPEGFRVRAGDTVDVVAVLAVEDGTPLSGKQIAWSTSVGRIEAKTRATDALGEVWARFFAPDNVESDLPVTITVSFAGDEDYLPSQDNSEGVVIPKTLPKTTLTVTPASFNIIPDNIQVLTARLTTEGGMALPRKPVQWSVNIGEITPSGNVTDSRGEVRATYRAPENIDVNTSITVIVTFPGDNEYAPSTDISRGAVLLPEVKQSLDNLQSATQEIVNIQAIEENLVFLRDAVIRGYVGAAVGIGKRVELSKIFFVHENVEVRMKEVRERRADVEVGSDRGRTVLLNVENEVLPVLSEEIEVRVDNVKIRLADDYADVLDPTNDENACEYLILKGGKGVQLLVSIPRFSTRTVTISTMPTVPVAGIPSPYLIIIAVIILVAVILAVIWKYLRIGIKKLEVSTGRGLSFQTLEIPSRH